MKLAQIISEYRLCGRSTTLKPALLRAEYLKLLRQAWRENDSISSASPQKIHFLGNDLQCFHRQSVVSLFREIFIYQHYNPPVHFEDKPIIVDAGANIGLYSIYVSMVMPGADILTFEADPTTFLALHQNIANYAGKSCTVRHLALSDREGSINMVVDSHNPNRCTNTILPEFLSENHRGVPSARVPMGRLSQYLADVPRVDFLKMDIEGAEFAVFDDLATSGALKKVRSLSMEVHRNAFEPADGHAAKHRLSNLLRQLEEEGFALDFFARGERPFGLQRLDDTFMLRGHRRNTPIV
jgi:FkbM family methyltransferase